MCLALFDKLKGIYSDVRNIYCYITKNKRIRLGLPKEHYIDAFCIAGNFDAERLPYYWYHKQVRKNNRQIHKIQYSKGRVRKRNQTPYTVSGFRLFDKIKYNGHTCFIYGRRASGSFYLKKLDGTTISGGVTYKKLRLIVKLVMFSPYLCKKAPTSRCSMILSLNKGNIEIPTTLQ